jgi:hypothetical protein
MKRKCVFLSVVIRMYFLDMKNVMMVMKHHMMDVFFVNINVKNNVQIVKKEYVMNVKSQDGIFIIIFVFLFVVMV